MKKPIDPNLNHIADDDFLLTEDKVNDDTVMNIVGEIHDKKAEQEPRFVVSESESAEEKDFHASEHHRAKAQEGTLNREYMNSSSHHHSSSHHSSSSHSHHSSSHSRHSGSSARKKKKMPVAARIAIIFLVLVFLAVSVIGGTVFYLHQSGKNDLIVENADAEYEETIEYNGHTYIYDKNKVAIAFLGVDKEELGLEKDLVGTAGQSDTDIVIVIDTKTGKVSLISIPRDTMVDIDIYSASNIFLRTENMQLCLAYAYGDGGAGSCENVTSAISRILYNVPIEKYFALDLDGIAPLNDAIGGVTVESLYDFKEEGIKKGDTVKIKGDFAETYVRKRDMNNIDASLNRTKRQAQYIQAYVRQLQPAVVQDFSIVSTLYNTATEYSETNISLNDVTYLASFILSKGISDYTQYSIEGEMKASEKVNDYVFAEFYPDEDSVLETVVNCFYTQVD